MYSKKRPLVIVCNALEGASTVIVTNAKNRRELESDLRSNKAFNGIDVSEMTFRQGSREIGLSGGEIDFLKGASEGEYQSILDGEGTAIVNGNKVLNKECQYWVKIMLVEAGKVQTSGAITNPYGLTRNALVEEVSKSYYSTFEKKYGYSPSSASKDVLVEFAQSVNIAEASKENSENISDDNIRIEYGRLLAKVEQLEHENKILKSEFYKKCQSPLQSTNIGSDYDSDDLLSQCRE